MEIICKLPEIMETRSLRQSDLVKLTGLNPKTISAMVRGRSSQFDRETLKKLVEVLELDSLSDLIEIAR
jgi:DNA-binding Xre family transcriptional regulator